MSRSYNTEALLTGSILANVFKLATPMIVAFIFVTSYNFVDRWFVSRLGDIATAAIGMAFIVQLFVIALGTGIGSGINSYISRSLGSGQPDKARQAALHAVLLAGALGVVVAIAGLLVQRPLFMFLGAKGELLEYILAYLTIIFLFTPVNLFSVFCSSIFQGWGNTMSPMKFMLTGTLLNIALDPLLIFGWGFITGIGIEGAALATGLARCISVLYILYLMIFRKQPVALSLQEFRFQPEIVRGVMKVGLPSSISQMLTSVAIGFIFWVLTPYGLEARSAYTIVFTYEMVIFLPALGVAQAVSIMTGHNFGAGLLQRVRLIHRYGVAVAVVLMCFASGVILLFPHFFASLFANSPEVLAISSRALRIVLCGVIFLGLFLGSVSSLQGLGLGNHYLWANFLRMYLLLLPSVYLGSHFSGLDGVWYGILFANIVSSFALFFWHRYILNYRILKGEVQPL